jgi:putative methyltransferase (TIGR04325 family)
MRQALKNWIPPAFLTVYRKWRTTDNRFISDFGSWQEATAHSTGYDADLILEKVSSALLKVKRGEAVYERDSVLFDHIDHPFPLLAGLLHAARADGKLTVLDFGGSLGSSYFQCRNFLSVVPRLTWCIVEQEKFVRRGRQCFESDQLRFFFSMEEGVQNMPPDVVLFSSVLQYIENPSALLEAAMKTEAPYIIIDRTPLSKLGKDRICVQVVPEQIYKASYPCVILSESKLKDQLSDEFDLVAAFDAFGGAGQVSAGLRDMPFQYKGMIWRRR